jgi:hypothetical protein
MALKTVSVQFDELTADPGSPVEGQFWYNTTSQQLKGYINGLTEIIIDKTTFDVHSTSTSNPHTTTLELARLAGAVLAGDIDMNGSNITNVGGVGATYNAASVNFVTDQINQKLQGLDWQESVLDKDLVTAPISPTTGDRYIIAGIGGGWSTGTINDIAEWDGTAWIFSTPNEGFATRVMDENKQYIHDGVSWGLWDATVDHGVLIGLGDDDHTQYLLVSGSRAMTGNLDMGTFAITNVGNVDGVDVSDHSARHDPGGTDALTTGTPGATGVGTASAEGVAASFARSDHVHQSNTAPANVTKAAAAIGTSGEPARADHKHDISTGTPPDVGTANAEGTATSLSRSDHVHNHGTQTTEGHHALVTSTNHGFQPRSNRNASVDPTANDDSGEGYAVGSYWINVTADRAYVLVDATVASAVWVQIGAAGSVAALAHKSGRELAVGFAGNPKTATVTFSAAFPSANYAVVVTAVTTGNKQFAMNVESQVAGSFVINMGTNNIADLVQVNWIAMVDGESS